MSLPIEPIFAKSQDELLKKISNQSIPEGDCLIWQQGCCNGHPAMRHDGKTQLVRRVLWKEMHSTIPSGQILRTTCEDLKCVNFKHLALSTYAKVAKKLGPTVMGGLKRSANVAKAKRLQSCAKLNPDIVAEIRLGRETGVCLSKRFGVPESLISKVRLHKCWKDYSSPFSGLGARA
ncbi:MAG: hypothetical protein HHJ15_16665 [Rhodoferax sp.]|uniref:hypothetical protein n=1 Tax=Rhodoferax sp. TaxID=50421 RepID=UPI00179B1DA3|nr:hypothetical protein [Rhodoferax sp.]NMM21561.1 hypothetical protein [Rhodoferax sp.]